MGKIKKLIHQLGIENSVITTGFLTGEAKLAAFAGADVFVLPTQSDIRGQAPLEALASGLPVVITPECQFPEVEQFRVGFIRNRIPHEFARAITSLLNDNQMRAQMGIRGRKLVAERFEWGSVAKQVIDMYEHAMGTSKGTTTGQT